MPLPLVSVVRRDRQRGYSIAFSAPSVAEAVHYIYARIPLLLGVQPCLRWEDKQVFCAMSNRRWIYGRWAKRSTPDRFMPDGAGRLSGLHPAAIRP